MGLDVYVYKVVDKKEIQDYPNFYHEKNDPEYNICQFVSNEDNKFYQGRLLFVSHKKYCYLRKKFKKFLHYFLAMEGKIKPCLIYREIGWQRKGANKLFYERDIWGTSKYITELEVLS